MTLSRMRPTGVTLALILTVAAAAGCSSDAEWGNSTEDVCDHFAAYARDGQPRETRVETVAYMTEVISLTEPEIQEAHAILVEMQEAPDSAWTVAADTFAQTCLDSGWDG